MAQVEEKKVNQRDESALGVLVQRDSTLNRRFLRPEEVAEYFGIPLRVGPINTSKTSIATASESVYVLISKRPPFVIWIASGYIGIKFFPMSPLMPIGGQHGTLRHGQESLGASPGARDRSPSRVLY